MRRVLVIDDELAYPSMASEFERSYPVDGFTFEFVGSWEDAKPKLQQSPPAMVLLDIRFEDKGDRHGLEILREIRSHFPGLPIIMISSRREPEILTESWELGATGYVVKWSSNPRFAEDLRDKVTKFARYEPPELILGSSAAVQELKSRIASVAEYDTAVLVEGETGTGKELVAIELHRQSPRASRPLVAVNCGSIPESLVEGELFGSQKGAFTGAVDRMGKLEVADGGVLFLDEIGELRLPAQVSLLRFLDRGEFSRVGETQVRGANVRIIAATNRDLQTMIQQGTFREDLYHRLSVFRIHTPPLRNHVEDVPVLAEHFLELQRNKRNKPIIGFAADAMRALQAYKWPGNVRQLANVVETSYILTLRGQIDKETIVANLLRNTPNEPQTAERTRQVDLKKHLCHVAWALISQVYAEELKHGELGIGKRVAARLGLSPVNGFGRKLREIRRECPELAEQVDTILKE